MATITKKEITDRLAREVGVSRPKAADSIHALIDIITEILVNGDRLEIRDFGVIEVKERKARVAQNPATLEPVPVPKRNVVRFRAGRKLIDAVQPGSERVVTRRAAPRDQQATSQRRDQGGR